MQVCFLSFDQSTHTKAAAICSLVGFCRCNCGTLCLRWCLLRISTQLPNPPLPEQGSPWAIYFPCDSARPVHAAFYLPAFGPPCCRPRLGVPLCACVYWSALTRTPSSPRGLGYLLFLAPQGLPVNCMLQLARDCQSF